MKTKKNDPMTMKKGNTSLVAMKTSKVRKGKKDIHKRAEAKVRRMIAKRWLILGYSVKYQKAAAKELCHRINLKLKDELFDGILLNLYDRHSKKPYNAQQKILRRIVEKRQAQMAYRKTGHTDDLFARCVSKACFSKSIGYFKAYQRGA